MLLSNFTLLLIELIDICISSWYELMDSDVSQQWVDTVV